MKDEEVTFESKVKITGEMPIPWQSRERMVNLFAIDDVLVEVTIKRKRKKRSLNQNAYYHGVVVQMLTEAFNDQGESFTTDDVHIILRGKFLRITKRNLATNEVFEYIQSTTKLKTHEFVLYVDKCIQLGAEWFGIAIPPPHKMTDMYSFPQFQGLSETRPMYLARIAEQVQDIFDVESLHLYYRQNDAWNIDSDVNAIFNARHKELQKMTML